MQQRRRAVTRLVVLSGLLVAFGTGYGVRSLDDPKTGCLVLDVLDGDTIRVEWGGVAETVRLLNVNTPERGEPGWEAARTELTRLCAGQRVRLEGERADGLLKRDRWGRLLAYIWTDDGMVNVEMVRRGHSPYYVAYGKGRHAGMFLSAHAETR